jgi:hypothetical protein
MKRYIRVGEQRMAYGLRKAISKFIVKFTAFLKAFYIFAFVKWDMAISKSQTWGAGPKSFETTALKSFNF